MPVDHIGRHRHAPAATGGPLNASTRTIAIIALIIAVIVLAILLF